MHAILASRPHLAWYAIESAYVDGLGLGDSCSRFASSAARGWFTTARCIVASSS
jgi:hypothetical protein